MLIIRKATKADMNAVRLLIEDLEHPQKFEEEPFRTQYMRYLAEPNLTCLVATEADAVVAFGSLLVTAPLHHHGPVAEIIELIVREGSRGNGVGAKMIGELRTLALDSGCCMLELASNGARIRAHQFYTRLGFTISHVKLTMDLSAVDG